MKNKLFLTFILLTPILVITTSSLYFYFGYKPDATKNNGVFFNQYFSFENIKISNEASQLSFDDGKWVLAVYITEKTKADKSLYLMRQLNVALNRDIYRVKRLAFYSDVNLESDLNTIRNDYPRVDIFRDESGVLLNVLQKNSRIDLNETNPIFLIDPYGRAVMYFDQELDPKLILKDLKVLI